MKFQIESNISGELKVIGVHEADDKQGALEAMAHAGGHPDYAEAERNTGLRDYAVIVTAIHAEVNDFVRKDGGLVRVMAVDVTEGCYQTSDGGVLGFNEVGEGDVLLESEAYDELGGMLPDAVEVRDEHDRHPS